MLRLRYRSLSGAFSSTSKHIADLNQMFSLLLLERLLSLRVTDDQHRSAIPDLDSLTSRIPSEFEDSLPAAQWLNLPEEIKFQMDDAMNQFESADFQDYSDDFYDLPREFNILGSCLFHKGFLLASHLPREDLVDLLLLMKHLKLLGLTRLSPVHQIVTWNEVYLTRRINQQKSAVPQG